MSESTLIWIFITIGNWLVLLSAGTFRLFILASKLEAAVSVVSKRAAAILHSPSDHFDMDELIERFQKDELDEREAQLFVDRLVAIESNTNLLSGERLLATIVLISLERNPKYKNLNMGNRFIRHSPKPT